MAELKSNKRKFANNLIPVTQTILIKKTKSQKSILGIFLGYYEMWDSIRNYEISKNNGFLAYEPDLEGCYFNFEKIDNYQHGIHDYFKYLKFGFARATDQLSYMIRRDKISREEAIKLAQKLEGKYPKSYMGKSLKEILLKIGITEKKFELQKKKYLYDALYLQDSIFQPAQIIGEAVTIGISLNEIQKWNETLLEISLDDVKSELKKLLQNKNYVIGILG